MFGKDVLQHLLGEYGYGLVFVVIMLEAMGLPFPGESLIIGASIYAATTGRLHIGFVVVAAIGGAIMGDNFGYLIGRWAGVPLLRRFGKYVGLTDKRLDLSRYLFKTQGGKVVFVGRFIAILRTFVALFAGANHMEWRTFLLWNAVGGGGVGEPLRDRGVCPRQCHEAASRTDRHRDRRGGRNRDRSRHRDASPQRVSAGRQGRSGDEIRPGQRCHGCQLRSRLRVVTAVFFILPSRSGGGGPCEAWWRGPPPVRTVPECPLRRLRRHLPREDTREDDEVSLGGVAAPRRPAASPRRRRRSASRPCRPCRPAWSAVRHRCLACSDGRSRGTGKCRTGW